MQARMNLFESPSIRALTKHLVSASAAGADALPATTRELVNIRTSQVNGCGYCLDMHTKDTLAAGEDQQRLLLVAAWREATVFTEAERAALELAEYGARLADGGEVPDQVWARARAAYDEEPLAALVCQIATINAFNRLNVITRQPAGDYRVGQFG